jgi:hypothetical protein
MMVTRLSDESDDTVEILSRIRQLSTDAWEDTVELGDIHKWLQNFTGQVVDVKVEHENMLHLLAHFNYFGIREIRELLRAIYRDLFRYPVIQTLRAANGMTKDSALLQSLFLQKQNNTRFLGMGNPSESGAHLLYYFRQENRLSKKLFIHQHEILDRPVGDSDAKIAIDGLDHLVFVDDLLGSGTQAREYSAKLLSAVRRAASSEGRVIKISYFTLFAKPDGLNVARGAECGFDEVHAVHELAPEEESFHEESRIYRNSESRTIALQTGLAIAEHYGRTIVPSAPLGFAGGQMMLGLHHNVPDNTLPIFWVDETGANWTPIFPRYNKVY